MRNTISTLGGTRIDMAGNGIEAINRLEQRAYDIILCDYDLGGGKDGQQLLEEAKRRKLIKNSTIFMMVTAERSYERIVSAAELVPDDYLIKPFAGEVLRLRLERLAEKKSYFSPVFALMDTQNYRRAIQVCDDLLNSPNQYKLDLMRLKAEICLLLGDYDTAGKLYKQILAIREIPWARMGLAKSMYHQNNFGDAVNTFKQVTENAPNYMEAYDWLAKSHSAAGDEQAAQRALMAVTEKSPRMLQRRKMLGETAYRNDDLETARDSYEAVLEFGKHSALTSPEDYANLSRVYIDQGKCDQAMTVLKDARKTFKNSPESLLHGAVMDSLAYQKSGNTEAAEAALKQALENFEACDNKRGSVSLDIARACFQLGDEETGKKVIEDFVQNNHDDRKILLHAEDMFRKIGMHDKGKEIITNSSREVIDLNNQAAQMAQAGDLRGSAELLMQAVAKHQGNTAMALNAAHAILTYMQAHGWDEEWGKSAKEYLTTVKNQEPDNQKYLMLSDLFKETAKNHGLQI
ncbi:response regulator receiver domain-containing protein [Sulfuricella denitrificans skB26]|uniref:Response regulator receiver domain-containing protein n=2 Tax=Sulfuricella denitrificans TaxID=649841 RepID=S6AMT5_SULDS|nr:response regulator receiver domain-containing protein [Sulfuricella denitrificans skB26]